MVEELGHIFSIYISVTGEVRFTVTGIADTISLRRVAVFLKGVGDCRTIIFIVHNAITVGIITVDSQASPHFGSEV